MAPGASKGRHCDRASAIHNDQVAASEETTDPRTPLVQMDFTDTPDDTTRRMTLTERWRQLHKHRIDLYHPNTQKRVTYRVVVFLPLLCLLAFMLFIVYLATVASILRSLQLPVPSNDIQAVVDGWSGLGSANLTNIDPNSFTSSIIPIYCHSHNDYAQRVPLFEALSVGCTSIEADVFLSTSTITPDDLFVGHKRGALSEERALTNLYLSPLHIILKAFNPPLPASNTTKTTFFGPYTSSPETFITLLLDLKETAPVAIDTALIRLQGLLKPLRDSDLLTTYDPATNTLITRPLTIVLSGSATLSHLTNTTLNPHHDLFLDAPLNDFFPISSPDKQSPYNISNTALASTSLSRSIGLPSMWDGQFSEAQLQQLEEQLTQAQDLGIGARYWGVPEWPLGRRNYVWRTLFDMDERLSAANGNNEDGEQTEEGVRKSTTGSVLINVDDLPMFRRWAWDAGRAGGEALVKWCWLFRGLGVGDVCS